MTRDEAVKSLNFLLAAYPGLQQPADARNVWLAELERRDYGACRRAFRALIEQHDRFPNLSTAIGAVRSQERAGRGFPPDDATKASPDTVQRCLAEARAALGAAMNHATEGEQP